MSMAEDQKPNPGTEEKLVQDLIELFYQVDVNGDGTMEWDEFTGFCIDAGLAADKQGNDLDWMYKARENFTVVMTEVCNMNPLASLVDSIRTPTAVVFELLFVWSSLQLLCMGFMGPPYFSHGFIMLDSQWNVSLKMSGDPGLPRSLE